MDSMKGSLSASAACDAVRLGLLDLCPTAAVRTKPMADGGEGTARVLLDARAGRWTPVRTMGPRPELEVEAGLAWLPADGGGTVAVVESALASGLALLDPAQLDPLRSTTFGTGELLGAAAKQEAGCVWLAAGGSATVDGGVGAAMALGWRFLDAAGRDVGLGGDRLERIVRIEPPKAEPRSSPPVTVLCDVLNPLLGAEGAARTFGPQKGATPELVERLEGGLANLADAILRDLGVDVSSVRGGGAAGGLAAGAAAFFGARLEPGVDVVADAVGLDDSLTGAAWVVTGEGRFDAQSLEGKVVSGVVRRAGRRGVPVAVIAGRTALEAEEAARHGISALEPCTLGDGEVVPSSELAFRSVRAAAARFASRHLLPA